MLNDDDLNRYARQVIIPNFEEDGQENLLNTRCLIVGAGGLGCPVALYASAAGFGHIEIYDEDIIEISNLNKELDNFKKTIEKNNSLYESMLDKTTQSLEKIISNTESLSKIQ